MHFSRIVRNVNVLNVLLLGLLALFVGYRLSPVMTMKIKYALPPAKKIAAGEEAKTSQLKIPSITEYAMISEENLFHPERRIPPEKKEEAALPKPDFVLFGTLITDDLKLAYLEDLKAPRSTAGRGKRHTALKKGDTMSGFTLKEIETDKIVMVRGEEKIEVPINDPAHPKTREAQTTLTQASQTAQGRPAPANVPGGVPQASRQRGQAGSQQPAAIPAAPSAQMGQATAQPAPPSASTGRGISGGKFFQLPR